MSNEREYILKIQKYLEGFKEKSNDNFNFKCPLCGDGKTGYKTRAWFISSDNGYVFYCHNCSASLSFSGFLKIKYPEMYNEYVFEKLKSHSNTYKKNISEPNVNIDVRNHKIVESLLKPCTDFESALEYLKSRKIPEHRLKDIFVIENFKDLQKIEKYKSSNFSEESRIVLVNYNEHGLINGIISRAISKNSSKRYINLKFYENHNIYNLYNKKGSYKINLNKTIYVVEGAFDSMFLGDNAIAVNTSDLLRVKKAFSKKLLNLINLVFIPDADKRNIEIIKVYKKIIDSGERIVLLPEYLKGKDINEIILNNKNIDIMRIINDNTFKGLDASLRFNKWKKI